MGSLKWVGGMIGWAFGGPIGAMAGFIFGSLFDGVDLKILEQEASSGTHRHHTRQGDFALSLIALSAVVMKADGKTLKSELNYVKRFLSNQFGTRASQEYLKVLQNALKQHINLREVCLQIRYNMEHPARLQLLHYLFGISKADGHVHPKEVKVIEQISNYLGINHRDFQSIKAMFYKEKDRLFKILEISPNASNEEIKKAYRKMAKKYHPDKLSQLGPEVQKAAKEKFQAIQEAYETLKKRRGFK